jgi:hypothetical protein
MMAVFIALAAVAVERLINRRRLKLYEVLADVGWLTLIFAAIEFAYLFIVETLTLSYGSVVMPLWYTEWSVFKALMLDAAIGVFLILASVWLESAGIRIELRRPTLRFNVGGRRRHAAVTAVTTAGRRRAEGRRCDIEWHEAT